MPRSWGLTGWVELADPPIADGATLVNVSENIDETQSGTLMHGSISIAELDSRNLANAVIKGTQQKMEAAGTRHAAPTTDMEAPLSRGQR